jgi:signal transduction histidine kinase
VSAAATHLRQVISNLLENAAKYSPAQSAIHLSACAMTLAQILPILPPKQCDNRVMNDTKMVLVRVQDQGEGIQPEDQERIFEKFVRAPRSLTSPVRGAGLGLYICRRYVEAMGGKLWLEKSVPNEGSVFSFYLPYVDPPVEIRERDGEQESI